MSRTGSPSFSVSWQLLPLKEDVADWLDKLLGELAAAPTEGACPDWLTKLLGELPVVSILRVGDRLEKYSVKNQVCVCRYSVYFSVSIYL